LSNPAIGNLNQDAIDYRVYLFDLAMKDIDQMPGMKPLSYEEFVELRKGSATE
jgi:hypothetical protein